ncbi:MAG: hypothetical protein JOZ73_13900, partial [Solirubrobacterales bacterium]|nr:hypothetical protein [Solirubrobacterales bacterium]
MALTSSDGAAADGGLVHYCPFCQWSREASSLTILNQGCERCGCAVSSCTREEYERLAPKFEDTPYERQRARDSTATLTVILVGLFLVPALGVKLGELVFLAPFAAIVFAGIDCVLTARAPGSRRSLWVCLAIAAGLAAGASLLAVLTAISSASATPAFYLGAGGSAGILVAMCLLAQHTVRRTPLLRLVDGVLVAVVVVATGLFFIGFEGFSRGDVLLTLVFLVDLVAASLGIVTVAARPAPRERRVAMMLIAVALAAAAGDGVVSAAAAHQIASAHSLVALFWMFSGFLLAEAAELERLPARDSRDGKADRLGQRWFWTRIVLPLGCVLASPAIMLALALNDALTQSAEIYFGVLFLSTLVIAFARQAYLVVDNGRAILRERALRADVLRRNQELEALTGLASTMTESLEEAPIMERGLAVLHLAARSSSSALH